MAPLVPLQPLRPLMLLADLVALAALAALAAIPVPWIILKPVYAVALVIPISYDNVLGKVVVFKSLED